MTPQIEIDSPLGRFLTDKAASARVIVEVGTGGCGATECLIRGMQPYSELTTYEAAPGVYAEARVKITKMPQAESIKVTAVCGVLHRNILPYEHPIDSIQHRECHEAEQRLVEQGNLVKCPHEKIDLLFLDGGEFTTLYDFLLLKNRCQTVVIDDCNYEVAVKSAAIYSILKSDARWVCIADHRGDRNGWAAFERRNV
jgi:hypothetical protein